jgi:hypothetical protein
MARTILAFIAGAIVGTVFGIAVGFFAFPYVFPLPPAAEQLTEGDRRDAVLAEGTFIHANPSDPIHYGSGGLTLYDDLLHLESDFEVGPGPKFHVYLVPSDQVTSEADVESSMFVDLGRLRAFKGSQNYPVPAGVTLSDYGSVVIWCEQFGVLISPAKLDFGA